MENLQRVVMEVFGGCNYTCKMCPQSDPGRGSNFTRKMPLAKFEKILDQLVPKFGNPQINLEGSGDSMRLQIKFQKVGTKWLISSYANLES